MSKPAVTVSKLIDIVIFLAPRDFKECLMSVWNKIFSPLVQKLWPLLAYVGFSSLSVTRHRGLSWGFPVFHGLRAPSRAARQKVSAAEPWKAESPNWEPNIPRRSRP